MIRTARNILALFVTILLLAAPLGGMAEGTEADTPLAKIPQIDCSTARIPITDAIYALFHDQYHLDGPTPLCSKTHGAWLNLADGAADILFLIAPTETEFAHFAEKGIDIEMKVFGYDGLVFLGNEGNRVDDLSCQEIRNIYSGNITDWYEVGGDIDSDMSVYIRDPESGSQRLFENLVWAGYEMPDFSSMGFAEGEVSRDVSPQKAIRYDGMADITFNVIRNRYSIGYNIMSYIDSQFLHPDGAPSEMKYVVITGNVNLRSGPGLDYDALGTMQEYDQMEYLGETEWDDRDIAWHKAKHPDKGEVWVSSRYSVVQHAPTTNLKLFSIDGFEPTTENFANGLYPYVTTSYVVIRADEPAGSPARQLFDWVGTPESEKLIAQNSTLAVSFSDSVVLHTSARNPEENPDLPGIIESLDKRTLTRQELHPFNLEETVYLREGVYALSGKAFQLEPYTTYFKQFDLPQSKLCTDTEITARFNEHQRANLALITEYERDLKRASANLVHPPVFESELSYNEYWNEDILQRGDYVLLVQEALALKGYLSAKDCTGIYDGVSAEAVSEFRKDHGLDLGDYVDQQMHKTLLG